MKLGLRICLGNGFCAGDDATGTARLPAAAVQQALSDARHAGCLITLRNQDNGYACAISALFGVVVSGWALIYRGAHIRHCGAWAGAGD
jgi:hypothetical protein